MPQVLIVDDEPQIAEMIVEALSERGLQVKSAHTDIDAFGVLEREAHGLSLLVTDINLGIGVTGFDLARKARELNPAVTVVYISGRLEDVERFGVAGALLVEKPFAPETLAEKLVTPKEET